MDWASLGFLVVTDLVSKVVVTLGDWLFVRHPILGIAFAVVLVVGGFAWVLKVIN